MSEYERPPAAPTDRRANQPASHDPVKAPLGSTALPRGRLISVVPVMVVCLGLGLTLATYAALSGMQERQMRETFTSHARRHAKAIADAIAAEESVLRSLRAFYNASNFVERNEFAICTEHFLKRHDAIRAMLWLPHVPDAERGRFEADARQDGIADYTFSETDGLGRTVSALVREEYFPAHYAEPGSAAEGILGFDLASDPDRLAALRDGRDADRTVVLPSVKRPAWSPAGGQTLLLMPVYDRKRFTGTPESRRTSLQGFVAGAFDLAALIDHALASMDPGGIDIEVLDRTDGSTARRLLFHASRGRTSRLAPPQADVDRSPGQLRYETTFPVGQQHWTIVLTPASAFVAMHAWGVLWLVWPVGAIVAMLLAVIVRMQLGRTGRIKAEVSQRTAELAHANRTLGVEIAEREQAESQLKTALAEQERMNRLMTGREERVLELKKRINDLQAQLGQDEAFRTTA